jgi:hypothetical protein
MHTSQEFDFAIIITHKTKKCKQNSEKDVANRACKKKIWHRAVRAHFEKIFLDNPFKTCYNILYRML